ncbi:hypothetical protein K449DRAFT_332722 [Hypoxylon sp. EC38]|nr:hypothetical protein K449DRAFT_332722 [Hypoxylon sp. EC38]
MSLNGLDDAKVIEAHEAAATEPGGWFLLKYANRDEVELYSRGNGGIVDIRGAIAKYEETSPLYGFLRYRRRNVILKYQPEDCSRLVQARAAVHFNAVCDRFAPYDTTFEISTAKDLKDSKLSAACSLHAASGSASSSSSSLRRRRLNEIAEEEEEEERERKRQSTVKEEEKRASSVYSVHAHSPSSPEQPAVLDRKQITSPEGTNFASTTDVPEFTGVDRPTSPVKSEAAPRLSSQSTRPELYSYSTYAYGKPKVKLGPRPSLDVNKRPSTAGNFRPTAALPAGFKFLSKSSKRGHSQDSEQVEKIEETKPSTLDATPSTSIPVPGVTQDGSHHLPPRPATSSGASVKSTNHPLAPLSTTKEVKMTPEKARLMKAMKLREKKKMMSSTLPEQSMKTESTEEKEGGDGESKDSLRVKGDVAHRTVSHADSGIAIDPPTPMTINTEDTSDSHPNSPTAATSSEIGVSTKASSLSESTDETIQATKDTIDEAKEIIFQQESKGLSDMDEGESSPKTNQETGLPVQKSTARKASVGLIRTDLTKTTPRSEASDPLLDDALMDELQSATLQEAKPISVSKSPITPVFPNTSPLKQAPQLSRTVSNPMRGPLLAPSDVSQSSARSVSAGGAAYLHTVTRQSSTAGLQPKKNNIGSSISQRIKALEKLSDNTTPKDSSRPRTATPSSTFFGVRKQNVGEPSRSASVVDRASSLTRHTPTPEQSREVTPETPNAERRERSLSVASRLSMFEMHPQTLHTQTSPRGRPESVQVTARIIRDPSQSVPRKPEANANTGDYPQLELKQSPLVVDLQRAEQPELVSESEKIPLATIAKETIQERRDKKSTSDDSEKKSRRSSLSIVKDFIKDRRASVTSKSTDNLAIISPNGTRSPSRPPSSHQNIGGLVRRLSISSRRSSISRERDNSTITPIASPAVVSDSGSERDDKSGSDKKSKNRASRFIRRLSNSLAGARKNSSPHISPTVAEEDADQLAAASMTDVSLSSQPAVVAYLGDVNVQFPDNLLWKRRSMCLDTQGNLFLSAVQGVATSGKDKTAGVGMKRYHLSDFRAPYIPDVEVQELPNSVVLDLVEGSCLQIACEDRAGQLNVLHTLQDAHQSHN